ncbi:MAG: methyltransferase domain-containing protein [Planctomycetia bacterium]|nr:methyltransferase domain-containing protein [Planctomycetia bacterium]
MIRGPKPPCLACPATLPSPGEEAVREVRVNRRLQVLRAGIEPHHEVLEIGPWHGPIAPRALGYRTTILDIRDTRALREMAASDPQIHPDDIGAIEDVDVVGSACDVADLVRGTLGPGQRFDWVLSSHNVEHMPNPIRFLRQAAEILRDGGVLRMAIPDKRACFDHFRPLSDIAEWLQAHDENRVQPTIYQLFFVDLRRCAQAPRETEQEYLATRARLLGRCVRDDDAALAARVPLRLRLARRAKRFLRRLARTHLPGTRQAG